MRHFTRLYSALDVRKRALFSVFAMLLVVAILSIVSPNRWVAAAGLRYPYNNPTGIAFNNTDLQQAWTEWKSGHITANNAGPAPRLRVMGGFSISDTTSEGQGYGILLSSLLDEQAALDGLWLFTADHLDANGLMNWQIGGYRQVLGSGAATDGDIDMAMGMVNACMKVRNGAWRASSNGVDYCRVAQNLITSIFQYEVDRPGQGPYAGLDNNIGYELLPGDQFNLRSEYPEGLINLSYFAPGYFRIFAEFTQNPGWLSVITRGYQIVNLAQAKSGNCARLISNWNQYDGDPQVVSWQGETSNYFGWDAARFAWRVAVDRYWYNSPESRETMNEIGGFFSSVGIGNVLSEYRLNGSAVQTYRTPFFVANAGSAIWAAPSPAAVNCGQASATLKSSPQQAYDQVLVTRDTVMGTNSSYFNNSWRLFAMLLMTGNFPNLYQPGTSAPTATPTVIATTPAPTATVRATSSPTPTIRATSSPAPTMSPSTNAPVKLQYRAGDTAASDNQIKPQFTIVNVSGASIPMNQLAIRYYFTRDTAQSLTFNCDWAMVGCANLTGTFAALPSATSNADYYLEVRFSAAAGSLTPNQSSGDIQLRINKSDWSNFNETNDFSYNPAMTSYADWTKVALLYNGSLMWGSQPSAAVPVPAGTTPMPTQIVAVTTVPTSVPATAIPTLIPTTVPTTVPTTAPTLVPTTVPIVPTSVPVTGAPLHVQYRTTNANATDNQVYLTLNVANTTGGSVALNQLTVRYYFTRDTAQGLAFNCDYAVIGCGNVTGTFAAMPTAVNGADTYLEVGFGANAGTLGPNQSSGEIQIRFNKTDWSNFNEADDYSFNPTMTAFADWQKITLHRGGAVLWGTLPSGAPSTSVQTSVQQVVAPAVPTTAPTLLPTTLTPTIVQATASATPTVAVPTATVPAAVPDTAQAAEATATVNP
jgi:endo-1,4-beta-D-glucanase Y